MLFVYDVRYFRLVIFLCAGKKLLPHLFAGAGLHPAIKAQKKRPKRRLYDKTGGETGIRTLGTP